MLLGGVEHPVVVGVGEQRRQGGGELLRRADHLVGVRLAEFREKVGGQFLCRHHLVDATIVVGVEDGFEIVGDPVVIGVEVREQ